jgi:DnaJ-class molecular chaperone
MIEPTPTYVTKRVCDTCAGKGEVMRDTGAFTPWDTPIEIPDKCPTCNGLGEIMETAKQAAPKKESGMNCPECNGEMGDPVDTTYSNTGSTKGRHTGDIYYCENCKTFWLDDYLRNKVVHWIYG